METTQVFGSRGRESKGRKGAQCLTLSCNGSKQGKGIQGWIEVFCLLDHTPPNWCPKKYCQPKQPRWGVTCAIKLALAAFLQVLPQELKKVKWKPGTSSPCANVMPGDGEANLPTPKNHEMGSPKNWPWLFFMSPSSCFETGILSILKTWHKGHGREALLVHWVESSGEPSFCL